MKEKLQINAQPFDCMQALYSKVQVPQIRCSIHFESSLDAHLLEKSIKELIVELPILACHLDLEIKEWAKGNWNLSDYIVRMEESESTNVVTESNSGLSHNEEKALLYELDLVNDPPLKLFLIKGTVKDILVITVSHLLCDGRGFVSLIHLIGQKYSCDHQADGFVNRREFDQITENLGWKSKLRLMWEHPLYGTKDTMRALPFECDVEREHNIIVKRVISEKTMQKIQQNAAQQQTSVNDAILAAYACAIHQQFGWKEITLPCPVDLRRYKKKESNEKYLSITNLTGNYFCHVRFAASEEKNSYDMIRKQVSAQMQQQKNSKDCLGGPIFFHIIYHLLPLCFLKKLFLKQSLVPVTSYTNLGRIDKQRETIRDTNLQFGNISISDAFMVTAKKHAPYYQLAVSFFHGSCTLTSYIQGNAYNEKIVQRIMDAICNILENG